MPRAIARAGKPGAQQRASVHDRRSVPRAAASGAQKRLCPADNQRARAPSSPTRQALRRSLLWRVACGLLLLGDLLEGRRARENPNGEQPLPKKTCDQAIDLRFDLIL